MQDIKEELDFQEDEITSDMKPAPSFKGRLNLAEYSFSAKSESPRRSPRMSQSAPESVSGSLQNTKRKSSTIIPSPSPKKKSKTSSSYAPPETYAHLSELRDVLESNLICVFIGLNPGVETARSGHAYAHPSNLFWKLLYSSGITTRLCRPEEDGNLPRLFELGNTNIVARPSRNGAELSKTEMDDGVAILQEKVRKYRPEAVCIVGKSIWESIWRVTHGKKIKKEEFKYGWQDESENMGTITDEHDLFAGAKVFVACSTSGLAANLTKLEKEAIWKELGDWVKRRRAERSDVTVDKTEWSPRK